MRAEQVTEVRKGALLSAAHGVGSFRGRDQGD